MRISGNASLYDTSSYTSFTRTTGGEGSVAKQPGQQTGQQSGQVAGKKELSDEEKAQLQKLKARDLQVRQHEQAHMAAGSGLITSSASFSYEKGPDGVSYAVGGEVGISTSPGRTPQETIQRAQQIRAAALAPADPSGQDRSVAAAAAKMEQQARAELAQQKTESGAVSDAGPGEKIAAHYQQQGGGDPSVSSQQISIYA